VVRRDFSQALFLSSHKQRQNTEVEPEYCSKFQQIQSKSGSARMTVSRFWTTSRNRPTTFLRMRKENWRRTGARVIFGFTVQRCIVTSRKRRSLIGRDGFTTLCPLPILIQARPRGGVN